MGAEAPISCWSLLLEHIAKIVGIAMELQADTVDGSDMPRQLAGSVVVALLLDFRKDRSESFRPIKATSDMEVAALISCDNVDFVNAKADNIYVSSDAGDMVQVADFSFHLLGSVVGYDSGRIARRNDSTPDNRCNVL
jgi:hypothetical protein